MPQHWRLYWKNKKKKMNNLFGSKSEAILKRSAAHKSQFSKLRDQLLKINEEAMIEASKLSEKILLLKEEARLLSEESITNEKVIKNVDKILGN